MVYIFGCLKYIFLDIIIQLVRKFFFQEEGLDRRQGFESIGV